jgi:hypothetical protein
LDNDEDDVELSLDSEEDYDMSDTEDELELTVRAPRKSKKKVKFEVKEVPGAPPEMPPMPTPIDTLTRQMEDLRLSQVTLLRELSAVRTMNSGMNQGNGNMNMGNNGSANTVDRKCFICDNRPKFHRIGVHNCPEVPYLIDEGLAQFTPSGRLMRPDGSDLPRAPYTGGGVAKVLREERLASQNLKVKPGRNETLLPTWRIT